MEADAFLTLFINQVDQVSATDSDYAELRAQRLFDCNEVVIDLVNSFDFSWLLTTGTVTVSASASSANLASDFGNISAKGGVWRTTDGEPLDFKDPDQILSLRLQPGNRPTRPEVYSIFGISAGLQQIQTETLGAACGLTYLYKKLFPTLTDAANGSFLNMPEPIQRTTIWMGMMAKKRGEDFRDNTAYKASKAYTISSDQKGKERGGQLSSFFGS